MGEDFDEIDVSVDSRIIVSAVGLRFVAGSTSTRSGAVFVSSTCFGLFGVFTTGIGCLQSA